LAVGVLGILLLPEMKNRREQEAHDGMIDNKRDVYLNITLG